MEIVQIVTQRIYSGKLLVNESENEWISTGPGLVLYISFISDDQSSSSTGLVERFQKIIKGLMTAKLATLSGWKSDHSDAESVHNIVSGTSDTPFHIVVIPQATLSGKLKLGDKYLKYHRQVSKERGFQLCSEFLISLVNFFDPSFSQIDTNKNQQDIIPNRLILSSGTYGGRQGLEMVSTGPSTHFFQY